MKKINKTNGTPLGMAFLFVSVLAMPFSMKAVGINVEISPRIGAVVEAWGQIAGTVVLGSHPMNAAEWSFRNASDSPAPETTDDPAAECSLVASLFGEGCDDRLNPAEAPAEVPVEAEEQPVIEAVAQPTQPHGRAPRSRRGASSATIAMAQPVAALSVSTVELANQVKKVIAIDPQSLRRFNIEMRITNGAIARAMKEARTMRLASWSVGSEAPRAVTLDCDSNKLVHPRRDSEPVERLRRVRTEASEAVSEDAPNI
ncbi:MAG TPA: hypothetical protein VJQ56_04805 [Blastocatellia bacterium]|nr:hypothetical protein [Blastocatellia bacterium]